MAITSALMDVGGEATQGNKEPQRCDTKEVLISKSPTSQGCAPRQVQGGDVSSLCMDPFEINTQCSFIFITKTLHIYVRYRLKYGNSNH